MPERTPEPPGGAPPPEEGSASRETIAGIWEPPGAGPDLSEQTDLATHLPGPPPVAPESESTVPPVGLRRRRRLGLGAMGEVYQAWDAALNREVAVKRIHSYLTGHAMLARRFCAEARIAAQLEHPGIIPVHALHVGGEDKLAYSMKLVRGRTFAEWLHDARARREAGDTLRGEYALAARLEHFLQLCNAVAYANARGVVHRDLKPENVMVGEFGEVVLMDWGIARVMGSADVDPGGVPDRPDLAARHATLAGTVLGTPGYMSPEQAEGNVSKLDGRSDEFALGVMLRELVTLDRVGKEGAWPAPSQGSLAMPTELDAIFRRATADRRKDRYPDVPAFADDIRAWLRDEEVSARPDGALGSARRWVGRNRMAVLSSMLALALLVVALVAGAAAAIEGLRVAAERRERRLEAVLDAVGSQAQRIEAELLRQQGLLVGIAFAAERALASEPSGPVPPFYFMASPPGGDPPDFAPSKVYDDPASVGWPDWALAPGVTADSERETLFRLAGLQPSIVRALVESAGTDALSLDASGRTDLLLQKGAPMVWAYVATERGVMVNAPGTGVYPDGYDHRTHPWYRLGIASQGPVWSAADADESEMGLLVTCSMPVRDAGGRPAGVAAIDLSFSWLIDTLLEPHGLPAGEAFLVDAEGRTMVRSSQKEQARSVKDYAPAPFPWPDALREDPNRVSGWVEFEDGGNTRLLLWQRLDAIGWTYTVTGDTQELLAGP